MLTVMENLTGWVNCSTADGYNVNRLITLGSKLGQLKGLLE